MKKILSAILAMTVCAGMGLTAFAESPITAVGGSDSHSVKGTYQAGSPADKVYKVDITWGSMEFSYIDADQGTWNPETHAYGGATSGRWTCEEDSNKITVVNHSNAAVNAALTFKADNSYNSVTGSFSKADGTKVTSLSLPTAEAYGSTSAGARTETAFFNITGGKLSSSDSDVEIGTVIVKIS